MENLTDENSNLLIKTAKLFLLIGFIFCLGNITGFIAMNAALGKEPSYISVYWQRLFVSKITYTFIVPGLWIMLISGLILSLRFYGFLKNRWITVIQILILLIFINGMFVILPLADKVTSIAIDQMQLQIKIPEYNVLKNREDMFGIVNFLMLLVSIVLITFKIPNKLPELKKQIESKV